MGDKVIIELCPGWALGFDPRQWVLMKADKTPPGAEKSTAGARLRASAFIASTKAVLWRCIRENEIQLSPEATNYIKAMPETFREWYCRNQARPVGIKRAA